MTPRPISSFLFAGCLKLVPRHLRRSHGAEILDLFQETMLEEPRAAARLRIFIGALLDLIVFTLGEALSSPRRNSIEKEGPMDKLKSDLRFGIRLFLKNPGFAVVALLTLGLGIGANTAIFSVVNAILFRPLPFQEPGRLVLVWEGIPAAGFDKIGFSPPDLLYMIEKQQSFSQLGATSSQAYELSARDLSRRVLAGRVTSGFLSTFGVEPLFGRLFRAEEDNPGHDVALLSYSLFEESFGNDPSVVGSLIQLDRKTYTVIGVMPRSFEFQIEGPVVAERPPQLWIPRAFTPGEEQAWGSMFNHAVVGRLKPGVSRQQAQAEMSVLAGEIQSQYPPQLAELVGDANLLIGVYPIHEELVGDLRTPLLVLLGAVGLVLLIACANVANLMLVRARVRQGEMAIRMALGATRGRIAAQMLTEGILLALIGGVLGLILAHTVLPIILSLAPDDLPREAEISINGSVLLFTLLASLGTALFFALAPGINAARVSLNATLQQGGRAAGLGAMRVQSIFIVAEVALALVLLVGAGLLLRSFRFLLETDPGFQPDHTVALMVPLPLGGYSEGPRVRQIYLELLDRFRNLPSVTSVGASTDLPLRVTESRALRIEDRDMSAQSDAPSVAHAWVLGDYFEAIGVPLIRGRWFTPEDRQGSSPVVLISQDMAERNWPGEDPIGKRIAVGNSTLRTIVGIVGNVKNSSLDRPPMPHTYEPYLSVPDEVIVTPLWALFRSLNLVLRTRSDPESLVAAVRAQLRELDPRLPIQDIRSLEVDIRKTVAPRRFNLTLLAIFAGSALFLSAVGIYGVISYSVSQRTQELGLRMALGAARNDAISLVLGQGLRLVAIGVLAGIVGALGLSRLLASLLYGVTPWDPMTFLAVILVLSGVALSACLLPALRASRVDPIQALRHN